MKNLLIVLVAISLTVGGCTSRTYVNRISPRQQHYDRNARHHDNRYNRGYDQRNYGPYRY